MWPDRVAFGQDRYTADTQSLPDMATTLPPGNVAVADGSKDAAQDLFARVRPPCTTTPNKTAVVAKRAVAVTQRLTRLRCRQTRPPSC